MTDTVRETFTLDVLQWKPWLERAVDTDLDAARRERVESAIAGVPNSDYIAVLANDFEAWQARALVHRHVYTSEEPEPTGWRELGATTTSRINGCVFCASVHARIFANVSKNRDLAKAFLAEGLDADLPPTERAIVDLSARLATDPESFSADDLEPLRELGFDDFDILDIVNYAAFFANANRLMLTLGEPYRKDSQSALQSG